MSDVDFNNGFICGLAVKGTVDSGGNNKQSSGILIADLLFNVKFISIKSVAYIQENTRGDENEC